MRRCDGSVGSVIGVTLAGTTISKSERQPPAAFRKHQCTLIRGGPKTIDQRSLSQEDGVSYRRVRSRERENPGSFKTGSGRQRRLPVRRAARRPRQAGEIVSPPPGPARWSLHNSTADSSHTIEAGTHPAGGCHFPEGNSANSRWSGAAKTTGPRPPHARLSRRDCSLCSTELARAAGIPSGYKSLWMPETGGVAALDHRLLAVTPPGWEIV